MEILNSFARMDTALYAVCPRLRVILEGLDKDIKSETQEIRIRAGKPLCITARGKCLYITVNSKAQSEINKDCVKVSLNDVEESFKLLIRGSVYSHLNEIKEGYIMMRHGHRAGICGSFSKTGNMSHISSVNIRISRQVLGSADQIIKEYKGGGLLIAGPPGSGKTTVLRDFIRQMSKGTNTTPKRVCVVDTRGEISASYLGESFNDLGENTDILIGYEKDKGFLMAIRTMFPDIVAFDEFGTEEELLKISEGFLSGVSVALTAHINSKEELLNRSITKRLLESGAISTVAILEGSPFKSIEVLSTKKVLELCG